MTDEIEKEDEAALTAEYILGLLSPSEAQAYEDVLGIDPDLRAEYAFQADRIAALTDDIAPVAPPPHVLKRIKETLFHEGATKGSKAGVKSWLQRLGLLPAVAGGLLAALAVLWVATTLVPPGTVPVSGASYIAQIASADESLVVDASYDASSGDLFVSRAVGAPLPGRALELWLIAEDNPPVSLGLLPADRNGRLPVAPDLALSLAGATLAISDEPPGGSPDAVPSGEVLAVGQVVDA
ncbi:anti-sigma factor domain-containing protein [Loktanella sp. R86503]|uniref:anti-sigma factor n=1 Tax=Loktanella sp. R86503 TaxID=3093847 RepID=UPI0036DE974D